MTTPSNTTKPDAVLAAETYRRAAQLNWEEANRKGGVIELPGYGQAVMTGDLHGHRRNFDKLQKYAMLDRVAARHVILHEMIHEELQGPADVDTSHELLLRAAEYKCQYPDQVHFLQSNHELAQFTGYAIAKNGRVVIEEFNRGLEIAYGRENGRMVLLAINDFLASFPAVIRTKNRIWLSHSLPSVQGMREFDVQSLEQLRTPRDMNDSRSVFQLVWGRNHTREQIEQLAATLGVDTFILGHQPQEMGFTVVLDRIIILASDHNHGVFLPFDLSKQLTVEDLVKSIRKFAEVA